MQMGAGTATTTAHLGDNVTAFDLFTPFLQGFAEMGIPGDDAMAMINDNQISHRSFLARIGNDAICRSQDGGAFPAGDVYPFVKLFSAGERGNPVAETGSHPTAGGADGWC